MKPTLGEQAYQQIRRLIVNLDYAPGDVLREQAIQVGIGIGRTPVREALQRLAREHFITVIPRRGMFVSGIDVSELSILFETRTVLEPYAARLAAARGTSDHWDAMSDALGQIGTGSLSSSSSGVPVSDLMAVDRSCHEIMWQAAGNRFLIDTLDTLYAQSDRLWHLYLADVAYMDEAIQEHHAILGALRDADSDTVATLMEAHVRSFDEQIRNAVTEKLDPPLAG